jgi:hypothetical protein
MGIKNLNERLHFTSQFDEFDEAVAKGDKETLTVILRKCLLAQSDVDEVVQQFIDSGFSHNYKFVQERERNKLIREQERKKAARVRMQEKEIQEKAKRSYELRCKKREDLRKEFIDRGVS